MKILQEIQDDKTAFINVIGKVDCESAKTFSAIYEKEKIDIEHFAINLKSVNWSESCPSCAFGMIMLMANNLKSNQSIRVSFCHQEVKRFFDMMIYDQKIEVSEFN